MRPFVIFRVILAAIGVLTVLNSSHALRFGLCGLLLAWVIAELVWSRRAKKVKNSIR
jgi:uncharacterized membrane protein YfcA